MSRLPYPLIALLLLVSACVQAAQDAEPELRMTLEAPRAKAVGEALWLEVFVGQLPPQAALTIRDGQGDEIGTVSPFGKLAREAAGSHLVPLPESLQQAKTIELRIQLILAGEKRRPTADELRDVKLVYVPVSR